MGKMLQMMNGFMKNKVFPGFSLIEIMLGLALLGMIGLIVAPNFKKRVPLYERKKFISTLNAVAKKTSIRSLETGHPHKVLFNLSQRTIKIQERTEKKDDAQEYIFKDIITTYVKSSFRWDNRFVIENFYVEGVDEIGQHSSGNQMEDVWFFVMPEGMSQEAIINFRDTQDMMNDSDGVKKGLVLNPFSVEFLEYDDYQHP